VHGKLGKNNAGRLADARQAHAPPILPVAVWTRARIDSAIECAHSLELPSFRQACAKSASTSSALKPFSSTADDAEGSDGGKRRCKGPGSAFLLLMHWGRIGGGCGEKMVSSMFNFFPAPHCDRHNGEYQQTTCKKRPWNIKNGGHECKMQSTERENSPETTVWARTDSCESLAIDVRRTPLNKTLVYPSCVRNKVKTALLHGIG
jgi:hypothetical protein